MNKKFLVIAGVIVTIVGVTVLALTKNDKNSGSTKLTNSTPTSTSTYSLSQVSEHSSASSCWTIIDSKVYDVTSYIPSHPGGDQILSACGIDSTSLFNSIPKHQGRATSMLPDYLIGTLSN